jgi:hypothetical protein
LRRLALAQCQPDLFEWGSRQFHAAKRHAIQKCVVPRSQSVYCTALAPRRKGRQMRPQQQKRNLSLTVYNRRL